MGYNNYILTIVAVQQIWLQAIEFTATDTADSCIKSSTEVHEISRNKHLKCRMECKELGDLKLTFAPNQLDLPRSTINAIIVKWKHL